MSGSPRSAADSRWTRMPTPRWVARTGRRAFTPRRRNSTVFRRIGEYGKSKFRVRRYGSSGPVYLERKDKNGDKVHKSRVSVPTAELRELLDGTCDPHGRAAGFATKSATATAPPVCRITYDRVAYLGKRRRRGSR